MQVGHGPTPPNHSQPTGNQPNSPPEHEMSEAKQVPSWVFGDIRAWREKNGVPVSWWGQVEMGMWSLGCIGMVLTKAMATKLWSSRNGKFTRQSNFGQGRRRGCTSKAERRDRWVSERGEPRPQSSVLASLPVLTRSRAVKSSRATGGTCPIIGST